MRLCRIDVVLGITSCVAVRIRSNATNPPPCFLSPVCGFPLGLGLVEFGCEVDLRRARLQGFWRLGTACVAAYMLVLQLLFSAFTVGAANSAAGVDAFGNPLCITSDAAPNPHDDSSKGSLPECCMGACSMFAPVGRDAPSAHFLTNPLHAPTALVSTSERPAPSPWPDHSPAHPRAPPAKV